jgi:beta-lactamase superfamily II metal-dependent hydrolase
MENNDYVISFKYFDVGTGDAIWIRFFGNDQQWHNILVDGGYGYAYKMAFGPLIKAIIKDGECIDLWLISHIDDDHIGAVTGFITDKKFIDKPAAVKKFWFNHSPLLIKDGNGKLAVKRGIKLRDFLKSYGLLAETPIVGEAGKLDLHGLKITALTPTEDKLRTAEQLWHVEEKGGKLGRTSEQSDYQQTIETLKLKSFSEDTDAVNGSSIGCLVTYRGLNFLLLADSHPGDVVTALRNLGYSEKRPLSAEFVQLAHHGSKANTSPELLQLINTSQYVVTGNGEANAHPDKETLARVLINESRSDEMISFVFPYHTKPLTKLFDVDQDAEETYNFKCEFPRSANEPLSLDYLPFESLTDE